MNTPSHWHKGATRAFLAMLYGPEVAQAAEPVPRGWRLPGRWFRASYCRGDHVVIRYDPVHESHEECLAAQRELLRLPGNRMARFTSWRQIMDYSGAVPVGFRDDEQTSVLLT